MRSFRFELRKALALTLIPPAFVAGLYYYGSSTECSGGDCTGPMMAVIFIGLAAVPISLTGVASLFLLLLDGVLKFGGKLFRRAVAARRG